MMQGDPKIIQALNDALAVELMFHQVTHAWEKVAKRYKYKGLGEFFDGVNDVSRERRRTLERWLAGFDAPITLAMATTTVDPKTAWPAVLASVETQARSLRETYRKGYELAEGVSGAGPVADAFCSLQKSVDKQIGHLEAFARQISEQTPAAWLAERS
jgi:hypothetical protein